MNDKKKEKAQAMRSGKMTRREFLDVAAKATLTAAAFTVVVAASGCGGSSGDNPVNPMNPYGIY